MPRRSWRVVGCATRRGPRSGPAPNARWTMSPFEYLLLFAAIVLGLAISDLAISLHRLLNAAGRVRWGLLSSLAAILVFLQIVTQWWPWYAVQSVARALSFEMFIGVM